MCDRGLCRCALGLCLLLISSTAAASPEAHFRLTAGQTDFSFKLDPANPAEVDIISFFDPSGGDGMNACLAAVRNGNPRFPFRVGNVIEVVYNDPPPPEICSNVSAPVLGVEGYFGPLAPGNYIFRQRDNTDRPFTVSAIPEPGTLALLAMIGLAGTRRTTACRRA